MLGARNAQALLARAHVEGRRLIIVGDVQQSSSVGTGSSFCWLHDHGIATFKLEHIVRQSNHHIREAVEAMLTGDAAKAYGTTEAGGGRVVEQPDTRILQAVLARGIALLSREERRRTLVLDPTRQGRQELTEAIRAALVTNRTWGTDAMVGSVLELRDLTRPQAWLATSCRPGDIVVSRKAERGRPHAGVRHRVRPSSCDKHRAVAARQAG